MSNWVELHYRGDGSPRLVNMDNVSHVTMLTSGRARITWQTSTPCASMDLDETYETVKEELLWRS